MPSYSAGAWEVDELGTLAGITHLCHVVGSPSWLAQDPAHDRTVQQEGKSQSCTVYLLVRESHRANPEGRGLKIGPAS